MRCLLKTYRKELEVSEITIRRDLQQFEDQGVIERFYGGARYLAGKIKRENVDQIQYNSMKKTSQEEPRDLVRDHNMVFINSGSTAFFIIKFSSGCQRYDFNE